MDQTNTPGCLCGSVDPKIHHGQLKMDENFLVHEIVHKIVKFTLIYEASFVAICTEEDWNVPVICIQKNVNWILELFIKFTFSCCLGTRSCATKTCLSSQHFL